MNNIIVTIIQNIDSTKNINPFHSEYEKRVRIAYFCIFFNLFKMSF